MGESFFKPWRRKLGLLTLLMACVFAAGWVRSRFSEDMHLWKSDVLVAFVVSIDSTLMIWGGAYDEPFGNWIWPAFESQSTYQCHQSQALSSRCHTSCSSSL